jgi:hypothetical protein
MAIGNRHSDLLHEVSRSLFSEFCVAQNVVEKLATHSQFGDKVDVSFIFINLEQFEDVRMIHCFQNCDLAMELGLCILGN